MPRGARGGWQLQWEWQGRRREGGRESRRWKGRPGKDSSGQAGAVRPQIYSESLPFQRSRLSAALGPEPPASAAVMHRHPRTRPRGIGIPVYCTK